MEVFFFYRPGTSLDFYKPNLGHKDQTKLVGDISFREKDKRHPVDSDVCREAKPPSSFSLSRMQDSDQHSGLVQTQPTAARPPYTKPEGLESRVQTPSPPAPIQDLHCRLMWRDYLPKRFKPPQNHYFNANWCKISLEEENLSSSIRVIGSKNDQKCAQTQEMLWNHQTWMFLSILETN